MIPVKLRAKAILDKLKDVDNPVVVELGGFVGALSEQLLAQRKDLTLYIVDCWGENLSQEYKDTNDFHANATLEQQKGWEAQCRNRIKPFASRGKIVKMSTINAADTFSDNTFDLVFVDADHSYIGCKEDISAWKDKVKFGGWLAGHDYENNEADFKFGVTQAVDEWAEEANKDLILAENYTWFAKM